MSQSKNRSQFAAMREDEPENIIWGKNPVLQALRGERDIDKVLFAKGSAQSMSQIIAIAKQRNVPLVECDRRKLDVISEGGAHQGVVAYCAMAEYAEVDDILDAAADRGEEPLVIICDGITDPHNLGAIIRSAEIAGAHGVIIQKRRSAGINAACAKAAAGALEYLPVAKCQNTAAAIEKLKEKGLFIFAADMQGQSMYSVDLRIPCAIIIGNEGGGVSRLARDKSDGIISIPQKGRIPSLNASNAAAVLLYEVFRQRSNLA